MNIKKYLVDLEKTADANIEQPAVNLEKPSSAPEAQTSGENEKDPGKKKGRVYTKDDLKNMPELSKFDENKEETPTEEESSDYDEESERNWKSEALKLWEEVNRTQGEFIALEAECAQKPVTG